MSTHGPDPQPAFPEPGFPEQPDSLAATHLDPDATVAIPGTLAETQAEPPAESPAEAATTVLMAAVPAPDPAPESVFRPVPNNGATRVVEPEPGDEAERARPISARARGGDRVFLGLMSGSGLFVLAIVLTIGGFLGFRAWQALKVAGFAFFTTQQWQPGISATGQVSFGVLGLLIGTVLIGLTAILVALPIAFGTALFISEYAPARIKRFAITLIDLMAAIPSVVYGLWGFFFLMPKDEYVAHWISTYFGWIPIFQVAQTDPTSPVVSMEHYSDSTFIAGAVVGLMITPIVCSMMRESFAQAPLGEREGALALGATKWGMIRSVVLPFGKGGVIGGSMLGLGRALGETIAVLMIITPVAQIQVHVLQSGAGSVSALIASHFSAAEPFEISGLMAAGLALFLLTLVINLVASSIIARSRSGQESG
ncbi:MAG TPA: phosphate ABC transporter permease subunit PstC [Actinocrinis sp.]|nr:phosphate ABC transporter permease subunit PstC [Actinocrinis sp.]